MEAPDLLIADAYETLQAAAQSLYFEAEAQLIEQRAADWNQPFMLYVMGAPGSGKSTIINRIAGRTVAAVEATQPWINRYRFASPASERAEVQFEGSEAAKIMSVTQARVLVRAQLARKAPEGQILRIDWFLHIPEMPKHVVLVEAPVDPVDGMPVAYGWLADAILWVMPVEAIGKSEVRDLVEALGTIKNPKVPTLGVVTHMDTVPQKSWQDVLEKARAHHEEVLDHVVPAAAQRVVGAREANTSVPLQREIHNRFLHNAVAARKEAHQGFIAEMRTSLMTQFEEKVDRVLQDRWLFQAYRQELITSMEACHEEVFGQLQEALEPLDTFVQAQLERIRAFAPPQDVEAFAPVLSSLEVFMRQAQRYVAREAETSLEALSLRGHTPVRLIPRVQEKLLAAVSPKPTDLAVYTPTLTIDFPPPPTSTLLALAQPDAEQERADDSTAMLFNPATGSLEASTQTVEATPTTEGWMLNQRQKADLALTEWVRSLCTSTQNRLVRYAEALFQQQHGFPPHAARDMLMHLEQVYLSLRGKPALIPTPHMPEQGFTPVDLLLSMQDPAFITYWNQQLVRRVANRTLGYLHDKLYTRFEEIRDLIAREWEHSRETLTESIQGIWNVKGRKLAMKKEIKWSVPWALSLMPAHLARPTKHLLQQCRVGPRESLPTSMPLFLGRNADGFMLPEKRTSVQLPDELIAERLREALREETEDLWGMEEVVRMPLRLRRQVTRRATILFALSAGLGIVWLGVWGTGFGSMALLMGLLLCCCGGLWAYIELFVSKRVAEQGHKQTESVHELVRILLNERMDKLQRFLRSTIENASFRETIENALLEGQAAPVPVYISYKDLMARMR